MHVAGNNTNGYLKILDLVCISRKRNMCNQ